MISVIICTYNRAESLKETLDALAKLTAPSPGFEVIVVNNNSSDATPEVVKAAAEGASFPVKYVFEPKQGLSHARNSGIEEARGEFLVFTDDDIIPEKQWLSSIRDGFMLFEADVVSGPLQALWFAQPPAWYQNPGVRKSLSGLLGELDLGPRPLIAESLEHGFMFGANMAFRKSFFSDVGVFRTDLGVSGKKHGLGEDTEILERGFRAGKKFVYIPGAKVGHKVRPEMLTPAYIRHWKYQKGLSVTRSSVKPFRFPPFWLLKECAGHAFSSLVWRFRGRVSEALNRELSFWIQAGQISGYFQNEFK